MQQNTENFARQEDIDAVLAMKRVAVAGLSSDPSRTSNHIASYLQGHGYEIIPVNPNEQEVLGEKAYASVSEIPEPPDVVDVFRRAEYVDAIVDDALAVGAKAIWLQSGIINREAAQRAREAGLIVVMDRCMMVEHSHHA
ncbi:MAG TPA: CoA-binding protein [Chloroflexia bacterium]|nr:CoA-binding protein [Chloroflexia bacterium]